MPSFYPFSIVLTALSLVGCASSTVDDESRVETTGKASSSMIEEFASDPGNSHDGMCSGGELIAGCHQQACIWGSGLPSKQCPTGYYCWCW